MGHFRNLFLLIAIVGCTTKTSLDEIEKSRLKSEITDMFEGYFNDIRSEGLKAEFKYLDDSDDFYWVPPGYQSALSYDSVKTILQINEKAISKADFHWDTLHIFPLTHDIATYSGIVNAAMTDTSGQINKVVMIESGTLIRRGKNWKILSGQSRVND